MEITSNAIQTVNPNSTVIFTETPVKGSGSIYHRDGSGLVTLRGLGITQCRARFKVFFSGNIAIPASGAAGQIQVALAINGEPIETTTMATYSGGTERFNNVAGAIFIDIPAGCCETISVRNTSTVPIEVANANLIVERVA